MKTIKVVAAVICNDFEEKSKIFATARGYGDLKGGWEFPGGKVECGETPQQALKREIMEELDTEIVVGEFIDTIEYDYPTFHLSMDCFWAEVVAGNLELKEAEAAKCAAGAPLVFVPCYRKEALVAPMYADIDLSAAVENLLLEADELGLGAVWMGISPLPDRMKAVEQVLNAPENLAAFALVPCGYPAEARPQQDRYDEARVHYVK